MMLRKVVALVVCVSGVVAFWACSTKEQTATGCRSDDECGGGTICCRSDIIGDDNLTGLCLRQDVCDAEPCTLDDELRDVCIDETLTCCDFQVEGRGRPIHACVESCGGDGTGGMGTGGMGTGGMGTGGGEGGMAPKPITPGSYATLDAPEAPSLIDSIYFKLASISLSAFDDDTYVAIAGAAGVQIHRLSDGAVAYDLTAQGKASYGAVAANGAVVSVGADGYQQHPFDFDAQTFGAPTEGLTGNNITGFAPILSTQTGTLGLFLVNNSNNRVHRRDAASTFSGFVPAGLVLDEVVFTANGLGTNKAVDVYSPPGEGPFVGIGDSAVQGQPGRLWWHDPSNSTSITTVGNVPAGPRRVDCLEPGGPCAVSSFTEGAISFFAWPNRAQAPTAIASTTVAVDGPIGIDVATIDGNPTVGATGFNDDSFHLITLGVNLEPTDVAMPLSGCSQPGHIVFTPDGGYAVITCFGSSTFVVVAVP